MVNADEFRLDRKHIELVDLEDADDYGDVAYWETQPPHKRLAFLEFLRRSLPGEHSRHQRRLPRFFEVVDGP